MSLKNTFFGAAIGFLLTGPIGALLGAAIGSIIPTKSDEILSDEEENIKINRSEFTYSLLILFAVVIKADKVTKKSEILFVKEYLISTFGAENAREMMQILKALLDKEINSKEVCNQIRLNTDYYFRLELVHTLFKLAAADRDISTDEFIVLRDIAMRLSLGQLDFVRIAAMFANYSHSANYDYTNSSNSSFRQAKNHDKLENAYIILGVPKKSPKEVVKKAFRKLSMEYHPDKVAHLGEEYQKIAGEKFVKIKEAYDTIMETF